jgi:hypothetical protein
MRRREFIAGLTSAAAWPLMARGAAAKSDTAHWRAMSLANDDPGSSLAVAAFSQGLRATHR